MGYFNRKHAAIVLGLSITGLGVARSLGEGGITIYGFDYEKEGRHGLYSKYLKAAICPHPVYQSEKLIEFLYKKFGKENRRPILFPTADEFVEFLSDYRDVLQQDFLFNIPSRKVIDSIIDKREQYEQARRVGVIIPDTYYVESLEEVKAVKKKLPYPVIIKARHSFRWREELGGVFKGFKVTTENELIEECKNIFEKNIPVIIQRIIPGPNRNHFKFCAYVNKEGKFLAKFTLRKIRQYPVEFGIGSSVESVRYDELETIGGKYFKDIDYKGVGSAEFKLDAEDNRLKLIELNPRYWMQNEQATACGINFALTQYLDLSHQKISENESFAVGIKWINPGQDLRSFTEQETINVFTLFQWVIFLLKCKVFSIFSWYDAMPFMRSLKFGLHFFRVPKIIFRGR